MADRFTDCVKSCLLLLWVILLIFVFMIPLRNSGDTLEIAIKSFKTDTSNIDISVYDNDSLSNMEFVESSLSDSVEDPAESEPSDEVASPELFRIQFVREGRCLGISEAGEPVVKFCDPREHDAFTFENDKVRSEELKYCLGLDPLDQRNTSLLVFTDCKDAINLVVVNRTLRKKPDHESREKLCLSAMEFNKNSLLKVTNSPNLGARVFLTKCSKFVSFIVLLEEESFRKDRAALLLPLPNTVNETCNFTSCGMNRIIPPVEGLPPNQIERCLDLTQCVTVVVKTARRPLFVIRLAKGLRDLLHMDLPMIVIDDGIGEHSPEIMHEISKFPNLKYVIGDSRDLGIAEGRTMGVELVQTKYFLLFDDDTIVTNKTNIAKLVEILDKTDASLAGGGSGGFAGFLRFGIRKGDPVLFHAGGACTALNQSIPGFPDCFRCEMTTNTFLAKTQDALEAGGWSKELKIIEHKDFFLRLKAAGKKVVFCPWFKARNGKSSIGVEFVGGATQVYNKQRYYMLRSARYYIMQRKFNNRWNIFRIPVVGRRPAWIKDYID